MLHGPVHLFVTYVLKRCGESHKNLGQVASNRLVVCQGRGMSNPVRPRALTLAVLAVVSVGPLVACTPQSVVTVTQTAAPAPASTPAEQPTAEPTQPSQSPQQPTLQPSSSQPVATQPATSEPATTQPSSQATEGASSGSTTAPAQTGDYVTYSNARYGYALDVPSWMQRTESDNGDGITVTAPTGGILRTWVEDTRDTGTDAALLASLKSELASSGVKITYAKDDGKGISLSGTRGSDIVYSRYVFGPQRTAVMNWEYPAAKKAAYDPVVTRSATSFTAPTR